MPLAIRPVPRTDSDCYISASAYELIEYLFYKWGLYKENEAVKVEVIYSKDTRASGMKNDEARPCDGCHSFKLCEEDGYECSHFKAWRSSGKYDPTQCSWK